MPTLQNIKWFPFQFIVPAHSHKEHLNAFFLFVELFMRLHWHAIYLPGFLLLFHKHNWLFREDFEFKMDFHLAFGGARKDDDCASESQCGHKTVPLASVRLAGSMGGVGIWWWGLQMQWWSRWSETSTNKDHPPCFTRRLLSFEAQPGTSCCLADLWLWLVSKNWMSEQGGSVNSTR